MVEDALERVSLYLVDLEVEGELVGDHHLVLDVAKVHESEGDQVVEH